MQECCHLGTSFTCGARVDRLEDILVWNYSVTKGDNMLHWITVTEMCARVYDLELKRQSFD